MKQYLLIVVALLTVVGCQRRPFDDPAGEVCAVRFQAGSLAEVQSKAATSVDLPAGSTVRVVAYQRQSATQAAPNLSGDTWKATATYKVQSDGSLAPCNVKADGTEDTGNATPAKGMELHNGTYDFYAYSPARKLETDNKTVKGVGHYEDFMGVYVGSQAISRSSSTVNLVFEHECAKITFTVAPVVSDPLGCDDLFADSVVLRKIATAPAADYTIGGDLASTVGSATDSGVLRTFAYLVPAQKGDGASGSAVFLPKSNGKVPAEFYIKVNGTPYLLKAELPEMAYVKGNNYQFTARVKQGSVDLVLNVAAWNAVAQNNPNMGDDNSSVLVGSWGNIQWGGGMGGNPDQVTVPIQVGAWTAVSLPADFLGSNASGSVSGWGSVGQDMPGFGK